MVELGCMALREGESQSEVPKEIQGVLDQYRSVFDEPQGLPPWREKSHEINLKPGTAPFNVRPYRYPEG